VVELASLLPGPGAVVRGPRALLVLSPTIDPLLGERLSTLVQEQNGSALLTAARQAASNLPGPFGVITPIRVGWGALVGVGLELRADHVGFRTANLGPVETTLATPVRVTVCPAGFAVGMGPPADLPMGRWPGAGVTATPLPPIGNSAPAVPGVVCGCGAFAHPLAIECPACRQRLTPPRQTRVETRPPVVRLVMDDSRVIPLLGDVVIGRGPAADPDVVAGRATALTISDPERTVSRVHAALTIDGWDLLLTDRNAENGTSVKPSGVATFTRLPAGACVRVLPGTTVELGRRRIVLDA
jgi:hypothetical protein